MAIIAFYGPNGFFAVLDFTCPKCGAGKGEVCHFKTGRQLDRDGKPHDERWVLAADAAGFKSEEKNAP